jgi:nicotinamidase-related amidase
MSVDFIPPSTVEVPEIPYQSEIRLPTDKTAIIIVDMQNDFVKAEGSLEVPTARETVPHIRKMLKRARQQGVIVTYTQDTAVEDDPEFDIWPPHCVRGTWGWEIIQELAPEKKDMVFQKNRYDGFYGTGLEHFLTRIRHIEHLVIVGTVANICVLHTAASAGLRWFHVVIPANGISALTAFDQALTLRQASYLYNGHIVRSTEHIVFEES